MDIKELRKKAEDSFNALQTSITSIQAELKKYGVETLEEASAELNRLQGEYRAYNMMEQNKPKKQANKVDATEVDPK